MKNEMKKLQRIVNNFDTTSQEGRIMSREHARQFAEIERKYKKYGRRRMKSDKFILNMNPFLLLMTQKESRT